MTRSIKNEQNTLSLASGNKPQCLSKTEPEAYNVISWAINMTPKPTVESVYKICSTAEGLDHLDQYEVKAAITKVLEQNKTGEK